MLFSRKKKLRRPARILLSKLEYRVLFDAVPGLGIDPPHGQLSVPEAQDVATMHAQEVSRHELVFVDTSVVGYEALVDGLLSSSTGNRTLELVLLDANESGLHQITQTLADYQNVDAIHIVSHGSDGSLQLGDAWLTNDNLDQHADYLRQWKDSLAADADMLLYGCDLASSTSGRALVDAISELTGADVAASDDVTGNQDLGGDWDLEYDAGVVETGLAFSAQARSDFETVLLGGAPVPTATLDIPAEEMINESFDFSVTFDNTSGTSTDTGYAPYIDLSVPNGIDINSASYLGGAVNVTLVGEFNALGELVDGGGAPIAHPMTDLAVTGGTPGEQFYVVELPFGSFVPDQPAAVIDINATLDSTDGAVVGTPLDIDATGGFALGCDPLDNAGADPAIVGATDTASVTPTVLDLTKAIGASEFETATGPNYPVVYTLTVDIANGETVNNIDIRDLIPPSFVYMGGTVSVDTSNSGGSTGQSITQTPTADSPQLAPNNEFLIEFDSITGTTAPNDIIVNYTVWVSDVLAGGGDVIDPLSGNDTLGLNDSSIVGTHGGSPVSDDGPDTDATLDQLSIATQKDVSVVVDLGGAGPSPGDTLEYTVDVQISDFFEFSNLLVDDTLSDGQQFDTSSAPTFAISENGTPTTGSFTLGTNYTRTHNLGTTGTTDLQFDIGAIVGTLSGDLFADATQHGSTTVQIRYRTTIQDQFTDDFPSGDPSVDIGDMLSNSVDVTGTLPSGQTESDDSIAGVEIVGPSIGKSVYAVNGSILAAGDPIGAGVATTYRLTLTLPTADAENLTLTDYLPLPIFDATTVTTFNAALGPTATPPPIGVATYGPSHDLHTIVPATNPPGMVPDAASNSLTFDFGSFDDPSNRSATIDILFTVVGQDVLMADGLSLTNQILAEYGSTNAGSVSNADLAFMVVAAPELNISKGVVSSTAVSPTLSPSTVGPVTFTVPGLGSPAFAGGINSANLALDPIDSNLVDADAGDLVKFAVVVENTGSSDAFDLLIQDVIPTEYITPGSGLNLQVSDGDGNSVAFTGSLFGGGIELTDPSGITGAVDDADAANAAGDGSNIIVITYDLELATTVTPGTIYTNDAEIVEYGAVDGGLDHTAGSNSNDWSDDAMVTTLELQGTKSIVTTSEAHTDVVGGIERLAIGEIVRYQLAVEVPEGTTNDLNLRDRLPSGLQFLDDGTATVAFVTNGLGITSIDGSAGLSLGLGVAPNLVGTAPTSPPIAAPHLLGDANVGSTGSLNSDTDSYNNGTDPFFKLGTVINADNDADSEFAVVEFNALVLNNPGSNDNNDLRNNRFDIRTGSSTINTSANVPLRITEPRITNLAKTATPTTGDAGDVINFEVTYRNSTSSARTSAFDARVLDTLPGEYTLDLSSVSVTLADGSTGSNDNSSGNNVDVTVDEVPRGGLVTIRYSATLNVPVEPGETITNTADLTYTSLPAAGSLNGLPGNSTGSTTPGASGADNGERDGDSLGAHNNYTDTDTADVTINSPLIAKSLVGTSVVSGTNASDQAVIGELVQYRVVVTVPEGTTIGAEVVDTLDEGLSFVSLDSIVSSVGLSSSTVDLNDASTISPSFSAPNISINLGTVTNGNSSNGTPETITLTYTARVDNTVTNQSDADPGTLLNNSAQFGWTENATPQTTVSSSAAEVEVIEPDVDVTKAVTPAFVDAGDVVTYTIDIAHNPGSDTDAFDLTFNDPISNDLAVNLATDVTVSHSTAGDISGLFELTAGNVLQTIAGNSFDLLVGETVTITIDGQVLTSATPNEDISNSATADWTSLDGTDPHERDGSGLLNDYMETATASNTVLSPTILKNIVATGVNSATNDNMEAVVGETIQYRVTLGVPESTLELASLNDNLDLGLEFVSLDSVQALSNGVPTGLVASTVDSFANTASFAPVVGGDGGTTAQTLTFDFGTLTNADTDSTSPETIEVTYTVRVLNAANNQSDGGPGNLLDNSAVLSWDIAGVVNATPPANAPDVEVIEPRLVLAKSANPMSGDANDPITYTIEIEHAADSDTDAFDVTFSDVVPSQINVVFPADVTVVHSAAGDITALFEFTAGNELRTIAGNSIDLLVGETVTVTINGILDISVIPTESIPNEAFAQWTSVDGVNAGERNGSDGVGGALNDYEASSSVVISGLPPFLSKRLLNTSITTSDNANDEAVIGELIQFEVEVFLPEGTSPDAEMVDTLGIGLEFISLDRIESEVGGVPSSDITSSVDAFANTASFDPIVAGDGISTGQTLTFDLGTLVNANTDNTQADAVVFTYTARVLNIPTNASNGAAAGTSLGNTAFYRFDINSGSPVSTTSHSATPVEVIEPELDITKAIDDGTLHLGQVANYTLTIEHTTNSDADANDIVVTDLVPANMALNLGSIAVAGATVNSNASVGNNINLVLDTLAVGNTITITYAAAVTSDQTQLGTTLDNTANLTWTSLPDSTSSGTGPERDGDSGTGGEDDYTDSVNETATIVHPLVELTKTLVAPPVPASSGTAGNWDVTYDLQITSTGNDPLTQVSLLEDLSAQYGGAFVRLVPQTGALATIQSSTANDAIELNTAYDGGVTDPELIDNAGTNTNNLANGESVTIRIIVEVDPDAIAALLDADGDLVNQAEVDGTGEDTRVVAEDDSDDPNDVTNADPNADNNPDDPNQIRFPIISLEKSIVGSPVVASSATPGNYDVTYQFVIENDGTTSLDSVTLVEDLQTQLGGAFVRIVPQAGDPAVVTATSASLAPGINSLYDGRPGNTNIFDASPSQIDVNQSITVQIIVEVDPDNAAAIYDAVTGDGNNDLENQATAAARDTVTSTPVDDHSDDPADATDNDDDADNDPDDPTTFLLPDITLTKSLVGVPAAASSGTVGNIDVTYDLEISNVGNDALHSLTLLEDLATQYGGAFIGIVPQGGDAATIQSSTASDPIELNLGYDGGTSDSQLIDNTSGNTNRLGIGESIVIRIVIEIDPDAATANYANNSLVNQASTTGTGEQSVVVVSDDSDDPSDNTNVDPNSDNDPDDPNRIRIPKISLTKSVVGTPIPASSSADGNYDVTYEFVIENDGTTSLVNLALNEDLESQFGGAFIRIVGTPVISTSTATIDPGINGAFDGTATNSNIFSGSPSLLDVNQSVTVQVVVEMDPDNGTANYDAITNDGNNDLENQASTTGTDPVSSQLVTDNSDDPTDVTNIDDDADNDPDDPTVILLPTISLSKTQVGAPAAASSGLAGNFDITFDFAITNTGNEGLATLSLIEDLQAQYGGAFIQLVGTPSITASSATDDPELNAAYDGGIADAEVFDNSGANTNLLDIGQSVTLRMVIEVDPDALGAIYTNNNLVNQAAVEGTGIQSGVTVDDDSDDPTNASNADNDADNDPDDPNTIRFPVISLQKSVVGSPVPATSGTQDNFDVTYQFVIENDGTTPLETLTLVEDLVSQFGGAFVSIVPQAGAVAVITASTATNDPSINAAYDGTAANSNIFDGTASLLDVNQTIVVQVVVEVDPDNATATYDNTTGDGNGDLENQASATGADPETGLTVDDNSDDPTNATNSDDDSDNDPDDPTGLLLPNVTLTKSLVGTPLPATSGVTGNFEITYDLRIDNNGNEALNSLSLVEDLTTQYAGGFVRIVPQAGSPASIVASTAIDNPEINAAYDGGASDTQIFDNSGGNANLLGVGDSIIVRIVVEVDPDNATANLVNGGLFNQATVVGSGEQTGLTVDDESDDQSDSTNSDPNADNDPDDPSEIRIPVISLQKSVVGSPVPASSGIPDNYDVTYQFVIENDGTTPLENLTLIEDLASQFGGAFIQIIGTPSITSSTATDNPGINTTYDGTITNSNIFDGTASLLDVNETISVQIVVEVDPDAATAIYDGITADGTSDLENQASAAGEDPETSVSVDDNSDDPSDASNSDNDADNDPDDPTSVIFPNVTLTKTLVGSPVATSSGMAGNFDVTYDLTIINNGSEGLNGLSLLEDLATQYLGAFVQIVPQAGAPATIQSSSATDDPEINVAYDGGVTDSQLFDNTGANTNLLDVGQQVTVRVIIEVDPDSPTANVINGGLFNQATFEGTGQSSAETVGDDSDDPSDSTNSDPNGDNDPDDPNEIRFPVISLQKRVVGTPIPATSGMQDNFDVTYEFLIENDGTTPLQSLTLNEDFQTQFGGAFVRVVGTPAITGSTATDDPGISALFDGTAANSNVFDGSASLLDTNQTITVQIVVEVDPDNTAATYDAISGDGNGDLENQATTTGEDPTDPGNPIGDSSDDPTDATDNDNDADNDPDDPTGILLPNITLNKSLVGAPIPATSGTTGNFEVTYELEVINNGNEALESLSLLEDLATQYGGGFVQIVPQAGATATIVASTATDAPEVNTGYDGGATDSQIFNNTGTNTNLLAVGESLTVRIVIEIDPDNASANLVNGGLFNQATAEGTGEQTGLTVNDNSDDQANATNDDPNADNDPDDPNEIRIPHVSLTKQVVGSPVPASSGIQDSYDVTYEFVIENDGTTPLENIALLEDLASQFGGAFVRITGMPAITASTATGDPGINVAYDGTAANSNVFAASPNLLDVNETITVQIVVEIDPDNATATYDAVTGDGNGDLENQATVAANDPQDVTTVVDDHSDDPTDATNSDDDADNDPDDPTSILLPNITLTKSLVGAPVPATSGTVGNFEVTYDLQVLNNGNEALNSLSLLEDLSMQYAGGFVRIVPQFGAPASIVASTASDDPEINASYDGGTSDSQLFDNAGESTNSLDVGASLTVRVVVEIDPDNVTANLVNGGLFNQATVEGIGDQTGSMVTDDSDDQTNPTDIDPDTDNDPDDSNEIRIPNISIQKEIVGTPTPAASGVNGNWDVAYSFTIENDGTTPLQSLTLLEDLQTQFGGAFVAVVTSPTITASTATDDPGLNSLYDGTPTNSNVFDGSASLLDVNQSVTVQIVVEIDPDSGTAVYDGIAGDSTGDLENQATTTGEDPANPGMFVDDNSDNPTVATDNDDDGDNDPDDPTGLVLPDVTLDKTLVGTPVPASGGTVGNFDVTYDLTINNIGNDPLNSLSLVENLSTQYGGAFVQIVGAPVITATTAADNPELNAAYDGGLTDAELFDNSGTNTNLLGTGEAVTVRLVLEVDPDNAAAIYLNGSLVNQATVEGAGVGTGQTITDVSDDTNDTADSDPNTDNDPDDLSEIRIPNVSLEKELIAGPVPATSGTQGNFDVVYEFVISNDGTTPLGNLSLTEDLATQFGGAFVQIVGAPTISASTAVVDPGINPAYDGTALNSNLFDGSPSLLGVNDTLTIQLTVEVDPDASTAIYAAITGDGNTDLENQATVTGDDPQTGNMVSDTSDDPTDPADDDGDRFDPNDDDNDPDDPVSLIVPDITLAKSSVGSAVPATSGVQGNFELTYDLQIINTGNDRLATLSLLENLATQYGGSFVQLVGTPSIVASTATDSPELNAGFDGGLTDAQIFDNLGPNVNLLMPSESVTVRIVVEVDADSPTAVYNNGALQNQAAATGDGLSTGETVTDESDDPNNLTNHDPDSDNNPDDPNSVRIPDVTLTKTAGAPALAASGTIGNFDVPYTFVISNTGTTPLQSMTLTDDWAGQFGAAFIRVVPSSVVVANISAATVPSENVAYTGAAGQNILDGTGTFNPGESFEVNVVIEVDPNATGAITVNGSLENLATATAEDPVDPGNPVFDNSDDPADPTDSDPDADNNPDDPTNLVIPEIGAAKRIVQTVPSSTTFGIYNAIYEITFRNLGTVTLTNLSFIDDFAGNIGPAFQGMVSPPTIFASTATANPNLDPNFDGNLAGSGNSELFDTTSGVLAPGEEITVRFEVQIESDLLTATSNNQTTVSGVGGGVTVFDDSDTGLDPEGTNPGEIGDSGGENDPTLPPVLSIVKSQGTPLPAGPDGRSWDVPFTLVIANNGITEISNLALIEDIASQFGSEFAAATAPIIDGTGVVGGTPPGANTAWTSNTALNMLDGTGLLLPGDSFEVTFSVQVDLLVTGGSTTLENQAIIRGNDPGNPNILVEDASDDGSDTTGTNPGFSGDTGGNDDPTPLVLPRISLAKQVVDVVQNGATFDLTIELTLENTGSVDFGNLALFDDLSTQYAPHFGAIAAAPVITSSTATIDPTINANFDGVTDVQIFDGVSGLLEPSQRITVQLVATLDPDFTQLSDGMLVVENQATVEGTPLDGNGHPLLDPNGNPIPPSTDLSDSGDDPQSNNLGAAGDTRGFHDPTPIEISVFAFDSNNNFLHGFNRGPTTLRYFRPQPVLNTIYTGIVEPGATLNFRIYDQTGLEIGNRTVVADAAGNWLAHFPNTTVHTNAGHYGHSHFGSSFDGISSSNLTEHGARGHHVFRSWNFGGSASFSTRTMTSSTLGHRLYHMPGADIDGQPHRVEMRQTPATYNTSLGSPNTHWGGQRHFQPGVHPTNYFFQLSTIGNVLAETPNNQLRAVHTQNSRPLQFGVDVNEVENRTQMVSW